MIVGNREMSASNIEIKNLGVKVIPWTPRAKRHQRELSICAISQKKRRRKVNEQVVKTHL